MKKIVRLTESDLTRLVKRIIKEQEYEMESSSECESLFDEMGYIFDDYMIQAKSIGLDTVNEEEYPELLEELYYDLESRLQEVLNTAEEMQCDDIDTLELEHKNLLSNFAEFF